MYGFLRFVIFFGTLVGLLVFVAVPALASPLLTQMVRDAGLRSDEMRVSIAYFDPSLFWGHSQRMRIETGDVGLGAATARGLDVALGDVDLFSQTFETVSGNARGVVLSARGLDVTLDRIEIDGPSTQAGVAAYMTPQQTAAAVRQAAGLLGLTLSDVQLVDGAIRVALGGIATQGALTVEGGALVLRPALGPAFVLLQPAPTDPWRLTEAQVTRDGVVLRGVVDAEAIATRLRRGR